MESSVGLGQGKKISDLPEENPGNREKRKEGEGSRESTLIPLIMHLRREEEAELGEALPRWEKVELVKCRRSPVAAMLW